MASCRGSRVFAGLRSVARRQGRHGRVPDSLSACSALLQTLPVSPALVPTRNMVDFASSDILGIEKLQNTAKSTKGNRQEDNEATGSNLLRSSMSMLHGKGSSIVSDRSFSDMLRPMLDRLTERDTLYVDQNFSERHQLTPCQAQIHTFDAEDEVAVQAMLRGSKAHQKVMIVEHGSTSASVRRLKKLCRAAKESKARLVLSDTHGTILMRHITGDQPDLLTVLQHPDVICSNLDLISGSRKVSCTTGDRAFIESLNPSRYEGTIQTDTVTQILQRFQLLPSLGAQCYYSLTRSQSLKRTLEELGLQVKVLGYKLFIPTPAQKAHMIFTNLWDSGIQVNDANSAEDTGIQVVVKPSHTNDDIRTFILALCDTLNIPVVDSALTRFPRREMGLANWTGPEVVSQKRKEVKEWPVISDQEYSILESVYCWDSYGKDSTNRGISDDSIDHSPSVTTTHGKGHTTSLLDDPMDSGLI